MLKHITTTLGELNYTLSELDHVLAKDKYFKYNLSHVLNYILLLLRQR